MIKAEPKKNKTFTEAVESNFGKTEGVFFPVPSPSENTLELPEEISKLEQEKEDTERLYLKDKSSRWNKHLTSNLNHPVGI